MEAEEFAEEMEVLVNVGATILGGCCGTTPEFIRQIHERFGTDDKGTASRRPDGIRYLTSERITHSFGLEDGFFVVGETNQSYRQERHFRHSCGRATLKR